MVARLALLAWRQSGLTHEHLDRVGLDRRHPSILRGVRADLPVVHPGMTYTVEAVTEAKTEITFTSAASGKSRDR